MPRYWSAKDFSRWKTCCCTPPFRYEDRTNIKTIAQLAPGEMATVIAEVRSARLAGFRRRNLGLFEAVFVGFIAPIGCAESDFTEATWPTVYSRVEGRALRQGGTR